MLENAALCRDEGSKDWSIARKDDPMFEGGRGLWRLWLRRTVLKTLGGSKRIAFGKLGIGLGGGDGLRVRRFICAILILKMIWNQQNNQKEKKTP